MSKINLHNSGKKILLLFFSILLIVFLQNCDDNGTSSDEIEAPSGLSIINNNPSNFQISWTDNSDDETGFSIERKKDSGSFAEIATVGADITEYTDTITESGTYSYRVRAFKGTEYSDYSNTVSEVIAASTEHTAYITSNETWAAGIHTITGYVYVRNGAILTIEAGSIIKFAEDAALIIQTNSGLIADGTTSSITFTGVAAQNGYWYYIQFNNDALDASCKLINCTIEYGGGYNANSAELSIKNNATVQNCTIRNSSSNGVMIDADADPDFTGNTVTLNDACPIIADFTSAASIGSGTYSGNTNEYIDLSSGTLNDNATFLKHDVPYRLNSYNYIESATLTVNAGAEFLMNADVALIIDTNGGLMAVGTATDSISFTGFAEQKGHWYFIQFNEDAVDANSKMDYCVINYGGGYADYSSSLMIYNDASITNCNIRNSSSHGVGIDDEARPTFDNNTITLNDKSPIHGSFQSMTSIGYGDYDGNADDYIDLDNDTFSETGLLKKQNVPYRFNNYNYIEESTLSIEAGTVIYINEDAALIIDTNGGLMAVGTATDSISFIGFAEQKGHWYFIQFNEDAVDANSKMDYCVINYGGGYADYSSSLMIYNDASITNCNIRNSSSHGVGIDDEARPTFDNNTITLNDKSPIHGSFQSMTSIGYGDYAGNINDYIDLDSGTLSETGLLKRQNVPYRFNSYSYIDNATLTIEAGTTVQMNSDAALIVDENGGLIADGTSEIITFTGYAASKGYWYSIRFEENAINANCQLTNCVLEYGGGYSVSSGIINIQNVPTNITGNTIQHSSSYGIIYDIDSGSHSDYASNNSFSDNTAGDVYGY